LRATNRKRNRLCAAAAVAAALLSGLCAGSTWAAEETLKSGVVVDGIEVGGLTLDEAYEVLAQQAQSLGETAVTLTVGGNAALTSLGDLGYTWVNTDVLDGALDLCESGNIVERYKQTKDLEVNKQEYSLEFTVDEAKTLKVVESMSIYDTEPVEGTVYTSADGTPAVEGGTSGLTLQVDESVDRVIEAVGSWTGGDMTIELVAEEVKPSVTYETLALVKDVLGTATTNYSASSAARAANVENGCRKISGTLVWPGEEFSVTAAVTPFTAENGYEPAPSYEENRVVDSYGGGICQVSTTLYNAVLKSELEVTARSNHSMMVAYVDPSRDAAIAEGIMDMAFINNTDAPIYIVGSCWSGLISFTIYGHETRPANRTLELESRVISTTEPAGAQLYANPNQTVGYLYQTQSPHTGYTAELWKNIYVDGVLTDSVKINSSVYQAVGTIYDVGVASSYPALTQQMYNAIANNDLSTVQSLIYQTQMGIWQAQQQQTETQAQSETQAETTAETDAVAETPATDAPVETPATDAVVETPATDAPVETPATDAPVTDGGGETVPDGTAQEVIDEGSGDADEVIVVD